MAYTMRMRIAVDVDITALDAHDAFQELENVKAALRRCQLSPSAWPGTKIIDVHTDAMLKDGYERSEVRS